MNPQSSSHSLDSSTQTPRVPRGLVGILAAVVMVGPLGIDTYLPALPALAATYAASAATVQQTLSVFVFTMALTMLFYGTLSDSFGRRPVLLAALAGFAISNLCAVFAPSIGALIVCRAFQGAAAGAGAVIVRAIIQDCYRGQDAQRAMAQVMMIFGIAPAIAPIIGGWLHHAFGWHSIFMFLTLSSVLLFTACYTLLGETLPRTKFQPFHLGTIVGNYLRALRDVRFVVMCLSIGFLFTGIPLYIGAAAPFVIDILGLPETAFAWLFVPLISGIVLGSATAERLLKRHRGISSRLLHTGMVISFSATVLNVAYTSRGSVTIPYAILPIMLYTFGASLAIPGMIMQALDRLPTMHGLSASMQGFLQMIIFTLIAGVAAPLLFDSAFKLAVGMAGGVAIGVALWMLQARRNAASR